ncbi:MAG: citrate lyase holo-[acyl-carrier protein] synthase [Streptococcaceae bacterium]|jgi:holo-ACP synthase CitX|nr:citrate lyase holo-[acyl-carrier protein] synthase [Streptococcaceae bacterium]
MDIFSSGEKIGLDEVLKNKEWRVAQLKELTVKFPNTTLVSVKLNIPGEIKSTKGIVRLFEAGWAALSSKARFSKAFRSNIAGPEGFLAFDASSYLIKEQLISFEENFSLGRLFDLDVYENMKQISRADLQLAARKCFICSCPAKDCARAQRHTNSEIRAFLNQKYRDYFEE